MYCPFCNAEETKVIDSRLVAEGNEVRRRRECLSCSERFTTFETAALVMPNVIKRDGTRVPFDEAKLRTGIELALHKRKVSADDVEKAIQHIKHQLQTTGEREVEAALIGDIVMKELKKLDQVAYVRFASIYRSFQDVKAFRDEIQRLEQADTE